MSVDSTNFNIVDLNPGFEDENDYYQAGYKVINRMACVYGEITFHQLFAAKWDTLMPQLAANVDLAETRNFIKHARALLVVGILEHLATNFPDMTFETLIRGHGSASIEAANAKLIEAWHFGGVSLPLRAERTFDLAQSQGALTELLNHASQFKYYELYTVARSNNAVSMSIQRAIESKLMGNQPPNDWCCSGNVCIYRPYSGCFCSSDSTGHCASGSNGCPPL